jgi:NitT/TauT family transport system permease protein
MRRLDSGATRRLANAALPAASLMLALLGWEAAVRLFEIPHYLLPAPSRIGATLIADWPVLGASLWFTLKLTFCALGAAVLGGVVLAAVFALSPPMERALFPFAVVLQVTPIIAIAPLILIYVDSTFAALLICAWIVAFFPILSNTLIGLRSADGNG